MSPPYNVFPPYKLQKLERECAPKNASKLRRLLYFFSRRLYGVWLQKNYRVRHFNHEFLRDLKAPYVIIANHVSNVDPFIYNFLCPYPIAWIIGKSIERDSKFPVLLKILRTISRNKEMSDLETVKKIRQWIKEGEVVGIFPEGQTSFTGVGHPIPEATAKLLRFLKVPVVCLRNEGGYFIQPRWAWGPRISARSKGHGINLHYKLLFDAEQIQSAKLSEIQQKTEAALHYNPYSQSKPYLDRGLRQQNLAESLELLFHSCLICLNAENPSGLGSMQSRGMELRCKNCGAAWRISDDSCFLEHQKLHYNLEEYYQQQLQLLRKLAHALSIQRPFARLRIYHQDHRHWHNGSLTLNNKGLYFESENPLYRATLKNRFRCLSEGIFSGSKATTCFNTFRIETNSQRGYFGEKAELGTELEFLELPFSFPLQQIFASHVFKHNIWEFHASDDKAHSALFVVEFPNKTDSAFLLQDSLKVLQEGNAG